jgi:hypothetical protein
MPRITVGAPPRPRKRSSDSAATLSSQRVVAQLDLADLRSQRSQLLQ